MRGLVIAGAIVSMLLAIKILWPESAHTHVAKINIAPTFVVVSPAEIPVVSPCTAESALDESCANDAF